MSLSEVIEEYIRRNGGMGEPEAFETFLQQERIRAWVGGDTGRRERLHREFTRVWATLHPPSTPSKPARSEATTVQVDVRRPSVSSPARRLQVLCAACNRLEVWSQDGAIECRSCGRTYDNFLDLIPVKPVGPFAFVFGEGAEGWLTAGGIVALLLALYGVMRWV